MRYSSNDNRYAIELGEEIVDSLIGHIKLAKRNETGGIIIGRYNELRNCATIEMVTAAPPDSKSGHTWFERGVKGLQQLIVRVWKKNQYYIGEWHFHPYANPSPSTTDIQQMASIATSKQYNCPEPILLIIGGNIEKYDIRIFVVLSRKKVIEMKQCGQPVLEESL